MLDTGLIIVKGVLMALDIGDEMYAWCRDLFPINRSLTGDGVRQTLSYINEILPELKIYEIPSGSPAFDWIIPEEWNVSEAWISDENNNRLIDFETNNLHLMGYSTPVDKMITKKELLSHIHTLPHLPNAIPYVTSYYKKDWGFCLTQNQLDELPAGPFHVYVNSTLRSGHLTYGEMFIKGESTDEILLTTYVCHPSLANNELSGPAVLTQIARYLLNKNNLKYSYRILFTVETIGSLYFLSQNLKNLQKNLKAGWVLTCIGDDRAYSYIPTRNGASITDRVSRHVLKQLGGGDVKEYSWLERGSDERQFNAPGINLPVGSLMRSKYGEYPEYHTSLDDLEVISPSGLLGGFNMMIKAINIMEGNENYKINVLGEPQLGKRGLYPEISNHETFNLVKNQMNVLSYLDGDQDLLAIADLCEVSFEEAFEIIQKLKQSGLISPV
jgi:aminopeptidase-like protein